MGWLEIENNSGVTKEINVCGGIKYIIIETLNSSHEMSTLINHDFLGTHFSKYMIPMQSDLILDPPFFLYLAILNKLFYI